MNDPDDDDAPPAKEDEIADLKEDLRYLILRRDRFRAPPTRDEIKRRVQDRFVMRGGAPVAMIAALAAFGSALWFDWPEIAPFAILAAFAGLAYGAAWLWEAFFAEASKPAWRARQAQEAEIEIGEIRNELFRLGVKEKDGG